MTKINAPYLVTGINWKANHENAELNPEVTFGVITNSNDGSKIIVPPIPKDPPAKFHFPKSPIITKCLYIAYP